jgi:hypothetical protein
MRLRCLLIALTFLAAIASDSWGQSTQPSPSANSSSKQIKQQVAPDQRGTDSVPLAVKILPAPEAEKQAEKQERERQEKEVIDKKVAFETQRIADYTWWLASLTGLLFAVAIVQAAFFFIQLGMMKTGMDDATKAAQAAQASAETAKEQVALTKMGIIDLERAYLAVGPTEIIVDFVHSDSAKARGFYMPSDPQELTVHLFLQNTGRTSASIKKIYGILTDSPPLGDRPFYPPLPEQPSITDLAIPAGAASKLDPFEFKSELTEEQFFWGYIEYNDIFKNARTSRFCAHLSPGERGKPGKYQIAGGDAWRECD